MNKNLIAQASVNINAANDKVWNALVDPRAISQYMFGTHVISDWHEGSSIIWKGEWQGRPYEDKGTILQFEPGRKIRYTHFSPLAGLPDLPENYHTVTVELSTEGNQTHVVLTQDKNANDEERMHSEKNWEMMLAGLKKFAEQ
ncbi:MAG TPA: SRPBCC domain-containing protein [Anaerolineales bacterium]|nr:SRPBCC domain-containing protein [Anaerolineales bacterium]